MNDILKHKNVTLGILILITIISKLLGLMRETSLAYFFGTSVTVDTYILAITIPCIIFGCLDAVAVAITPIYMETVANKGKSQADKLLSNVISWVIIISTVLIILFEIFAGKFINLFLIFNNETVNADTLIKYFKITLLTIFFNPIAQIYLSYLRCRNHTIAAQIVELTISGVQILFIVIAGKTLHTIFLPIGYAVAHLTCMILAKTFAKHKFIFKASKEEETKETFKLIIPTFLGNTIAQINAFVDKLFASSLTVGSIAALNYSNIIKNLYYAIFTAPIISIYYPKISDGIAKKQKEETKILINNIIISLIIFLIPITIYSYIFSRNIVQFLLMRGNFDFNSLVKTDWTFKMYLIGVLAICLREVFLRCLYSLKNTKTVIGINLLNIMLNIILNAIFINKFEYFGLALATSISSICILPIYFYKLKKEGLLDYRVIFNAFVKTIFVCIPMIILLIIINKKVLFPSTIIKQLGYFVLTFGSASVVFIGLYFGKRIIKK